MKGQPTKSLRRTFKRALGRIGIKKKVKFYAIRHRLKLLDSVLVELIRLWAFCFPDDLFILTMPVQVF